MSTTSSAGRPPSQSPYAIFDIHCHLTPPPSPRPRTCLISPAAHTSTSTTMSSPTTSTLFSENPIVKGRSDLREGGKDVVVRRYGGKYAEKLFVRKPKDTQHLRSLSQQIWEGVRNNDKKAVYRYIVNFEADVNAIYEISSSISSITLAKVMLLPEQISHGQNTNEWTGDMSSKSSESSNLSADNEIPSMEDLEGCHLLHLASEFADIGMLELLLQYGANVNASDSRGHTPLHRCILKGKPIAARLLLTRGADPLAMNREGKSTLDIAKEVSFNDPEILALLSDFRG
ncbi:hypothetical protein KSS87_000285 [Heliosperma pusillum]|nr:hypothetical protein KSS87_000285 [Heliosperma pusillum]